jgi:hypothetical protein
VEAHTAPGKRNYLGELAATVEDMNHMELALGTNSRSGGQFDIWEAVFSPVGSNGYPKPIWDKLTGKIDRFRWLSTGERITILATSSSAIGPSWGRSYRARSIIYVGEADNYYLNNAVYLVEDF